MPDLWGIAAILAKAALYISLLTAAGTVLAARVIGPDLGPYKRVALFFAIFGLAASGLVFSLRGVALTGDISGMTDPEMLDLLWQTSVGTVLLLRTVGLGLLILGLVLPGDKLWISVGGAVLAIWSFAQIGHVPGRDDILLNILLALHLLGISFWIGILIPLRRLALTPGELWRTADVGHRFGLIALGVVPALIAAGGYLGYVLVGSVEALTTARYGQALLIKVGLVAVMLLLAAANKLRFVPAIRDGQTDAALALARSIRLEWAAVIAILLTTATLTSVLSLPVSN